MHELIQWVHSIAPDIASDATARHMHDATSLMALDV